MSGGLSWWNIVKTYPAYLNKFYAKYWPWNLGSDLIDVANGDGGEVDVTEGRRRRIHRRHHRRLVELHALQKRKTDGQKDYINQLITGVRCQKMPFIH